MRATLPGLSFRIVLLTTFASFCAFYAPQPLLPLLSRQFDVSSTWSALLITVPFVFLAIAPLAYGLFLQQASAQRLLAIACLLLGLLQFVFAYGDTFNTLLISRAAQGVLFPAIFTAAVTYCSKAGEQKAVASRVALYIATTILGGMSGRLIGGFLSGLMGWRFTFQTLGAVLIGCSILLMLLVRDSSVQAPARHDRPLAGIVADRRFIAGFSLIFSSFFTFSACLNALPFRLVELDETISPSRISLVYLGYLIGVVLALNVESINRRLGGTLPAMRVALGVFIAGLLLMLVPDEFALVGIMFLPCAGMFLIHATLSGYLNNLAPDLAGIVNGLYISLYYAAGAIGSVLPLWIYHQAGWSLFLASVTAVCATGFISLASLRR